MQPKLPAILDRYFAAQNALDAEAMAACFAPDGKVHDEGQDYVGRDAIREWKRRTITKYGISIEPLEVSDAAGSTTVIARVAGNFPGSPTNLSYRLGFSADGLIDTLEIH